MSLRRRIAAPLFWVLLLAIPAGTQQVKLPVGFSGWTGGATSMSSANDGRFAGAASPAITEYGLLGAEQRVYTRGTERLTVTLYRMRDPSGAYGAYSFLRMPDMAHAAITEHSSLSPTRALALMDNLVLDVSGQNLLPLEDELKALAEQVVPRAAQGPYPALTEHLPTDGLVPRSDRYVLGPAALHQLLPIAEGDWIGFATGAEAELARYRLSVKNGERPAGEEATLLIADYPTPQVAMEKMVELAQRFGLDSEGKPVSHGRPAVAARRVSTLIALVAGAPSQASADALLSQIHNESALTWNEPGFSITDPNIGKVIVGIIVGTGILCLFTLIAGIAFGGVRLVVKHYFPDRVFDRSSSLQILQLGLTSKPIESRDLYLQ